jgi:hypothetical protein
MSPFAVSANVGLLLVVCAATAAEHHRGALVAKEVPTFMIDDCMKDNTGVITKVGEVCSCIQYASGAVSFYGCVAYHCAVVFSTDKGDTYFTEMLGGENQDKAGNQMADFICKRSGKGRISYEQSIDATAEKLFKKNTELDRARQYTGKGYEWYRYAMDAVKEFKRDYQPYPVNKHLNAAVLGAPLTPKKFAQWVQVKRLEVGGMWGRGPLYYAGKHHHGVLKSEEKRLGHGVFWRHSVHFMGSDTVRVCVLSALFKHAQQFSVVYPAYIPMSENCQWYSSRAYEALSDAFYWSPKQQAGMAFLRFLGGDGRRGKKGTTGAIQFSANVIKVAKGSDDAASLVPTSIKNSVKESIKTSEKLGKILITSTIKVSVASKVTASSHPPDAPPRPSHAAPTILPPARARIHVHYSVLRAQ